MKNKLSNIKMNAFLLLLILAVGVSGLAGCGVNGADVAVGTDSVLVELAGYDFGYSDFELSEEYSETEATQINLSDENTTFEGEGITVNGNLITVTDAGTYIFNGSLADGSILVMAELEDNVHIVLNDVNIHSQTGCPILIQQAKNTSITLADGSVNTLSCGTSCVPATGEEGIDGVIYSKSDLSLNGGGKLTINANYAHGIVCKDDLAIIGGTYIITAVEDAIQGKDSVRIKDGNFIISAGDEAINANNDEEEYKGFVSVEGGIFDIVHANDAMKAATVIRIAGGTFGIEAEDDAIHADITTAIIGGDITISSCEEGVEGTNVVISGGNLSIQASDDGINAAGGNDDSGFDGEFAATEASHSMDAASDYYIRISGGVIYVNSTGDGLDSNGSIYLDGGELYVSGPTDSANCALDYQSEGTVTGGISVIVESSGMAESFNSSSTQYSMMFGFSTVYEAGSVIEIQDAQGSVIATYTPDKAFRSVVATSPQLKEGDTYSIYINGESVLDAELSEISQLVGVENFGEMGGESHGGADNTPEGTSGGGITRPDGTSGGGMQMPQGTRPEGQGDRPESFVQP